MKRVLVLDVGTTGVRATLVDEQGRPGTVTYRRAAPSHPAAGVSEFDPLELASAAIEVATQALTESEGVEGVAIANQRASTVLWDATSGQPLGPGLGWQDLRTIGQCLALRSSGLRLAPNQSATKLAYLLSTHGREAGHSARFGTLDSWIAWSLSSGTVHATDATNAAVTGLVTADAAGWDPEVLSTLGIDQQLLPEIVSSTGFLGSASALPGAPPLVALVGDQQASLVGQGCLMPGAAKVTFGTGGMLDLCLGPKRPDFAVRGEAGTFPVIAWREAGLDTWGIEAILLAAGTCVEWLRDGLGIIDSVEESAEVAASVRDTGGVTFVPAFGGLGTPKWDFGAKGTLVGLDQSTTRAEIVHAVLDGIAQVGADLLEAAEQDGNCTVGDLCVDGGMSTNPTFTQLLADATGRTLQLSAVSEATTLGAAFLGGVATGLYASLEATPGLLATRTEVTPHRRPDRERWLDARERALRTVPLLSSLDF